MFFLLLPLQHTNTLKPSDILVCMNVYFSGIGGVGIGPLAKIAKDAGFFVTGSDSSDSLMIKELREAGIIISIGQDGTFLEGCHSESPIDWFVHTSALPEDHPELVLARKLGIKTSKRDEFLSQFISEKNLKLIAVAGTHGKTTTTGMLVWALKQLNLPISYSIGTTISFGPGGLYDPYSEYFIYECDEYDRNFLNFSPFLSLITSFDYDHPDTYPTEDSYSEAFKQFLSASTKTILWQSDAAAIGASDSDNLNVVADNSPLLINLPGLHNRRNAQLALKVVEHMGVSGDIKQALESFPGTDRRFEKLANNIYSDYGHHPIEIAATLSMARELSDNVVLVYQPHQNRRQHLIKDMYYDKFEKAETIYWLPTYLSREDPSQETLTPQQLTENLINKDAVKYPESMDENLWNLIKNEAASGKLVLLMGAGTIDSWARQMLSK